MQLKDYFHGEYQGRESFLENVIFPIFGEDNWDEGYDEDMLVSYHDTQKVADQIGIESIVRWGTIDIPMNPTSVYEITVDDKVQMQHNRVAVQKIIRRIMDTYSSAFMIIHYGNTDKWDWRFTFCSKGDNNKDVTDTKRYTFLLGPNQSCRTAADNFNKLMAKHGNIELDDIVRAFDVEALSDEFFAKYKAFYELFVDYLADPANGLRAKFIDTSFSRAGMKAAEIKDKEEKPMRDYVKKLLGRLVFIQFLQKKGWMGAQKDWTDGMQDFMQQLFLQATPKQQKNFLEEILKPLFEKALDTDRLNNGDLFDTGVRDLPNKGVLRIPYLNGGLFERDELDNIKCAFPATYFGDLFEFFYEYNFTIDENDPNDAEVGVDPEMLGRIFENLLEDNKDKGAFYTPKEIVSYMCRESLIAYLTSDLHDEKDKTRVRNFMNSYNKESLEGRDLDLKKKLRKVKICDPAIGSGAFPMGLLKELYLSRLELEGVHKAAQIKKDIIQQNIYGVDIEKGAVDIARLRFWLSLIVEEETPHALPNMDFKIMQGNSLMEKYKGVSLDNMVGEKNGQAVLFETNDDDLEYLRKILQVHLSEYYKATSHSVKADLRAKIIDNVKQQFDIQHGSARLSGINVQGNDKFFLWHTWFADVFADGGFDIVIGNPPYGAKLDEKDKPYLKDDYITAQTQRDKNNNIIQKGSMDSYTLFIELGYRLLKDNGAFAMIVPVSLVSSDSLTGVHNLLFKNCDTIRISSYAVRPEPVFRYAVVDTSILMFSKTKTSCQTLYSTRLNRKKGNEFSLQNLIDNLEFAEVSKLRMFGRIPKIGKEIEIRILEKIRRQTPIAKYKTASGSPIYYRAAGGRYFKVITNYTTESSAEKSIKLQEKFANAIGCILSSNLSFWFYQIYSDNHNWKAGELESFTIPNLSDSAIKKLESLYEAYLNDIEDNANVRVSSGKSSYHVSQFKEYKIVRSKAIIDQIDELIGPMYGLNAEEIDFIKNYELEFRMAGDE